MYIERDSRRQAPGKLENQHAHMEYLGRCMELLVSTLVQLLPDLTREPCDEPFVIHIHS